MTEVIKRVCAVALSASIALTMAFSLTACKKKQGEPGKDGDTPYIGENGHWWIGSTDTGVLAAAQNGTNGADGQNGLDGKDGVDGINGVDGITPEFMYDEASGYLQISYDSGATWNNLVHIADMVSDGVDGVDGVSISSCTISEKGELLVEYSDGRSDNLGVIVAKDGIDGTDGVGIKDVALDEDGNLTITLTDDTVLELGNVNGSNGLNGTDGKNGTDGITPQIRINAGTNMWEVSYDDGKSWKSLDVVAIGNHGQNGENGTDGKDGNTPEIRINADTNMWEVSYDKGKNWGSLGVVATGDDGKDATAPRIKIENGEWMISYNNGTSWDPLNAKAEGSAGADGRGIEKMEIVGGYLFVTYTDGEGPVNIGKVSEDNTDDGEGGEEVKPSVTDVYTDSLEFYPLGDGSEYGVKIGKAIYMDEIIIPAYYNGKPVTTILSNAFSVAGEGNAILENVIIGKNVVKIEADAFASCEAIKTLEIPAGVKEIGARAFAEIDCVKFEIGEEEIPEGQEWTVENLMCDKIVWKNKT